MKNLVVIAISFIIYSPPPPLTITLSYGLRQGYSTPVPCGTQCLLVLPPVRGLVMAVVVQGFPLTFDRPRGVVGLFLRHSQ